MVTAPTPLADWLAVAPVILPLAVGAILVTTRKRLHWQAPVAIMTLTVVAVLSSLLLMKVSQSGPVVMTMGRWLPPFGISFTVDMLGALFAVAASWISLACAITAARTVDGAQQRYGYFSFFLLTVAGVNGAFLTGDIFNLYVWFEVFLISSFGLLVVGSTRAQLDGTMKYAVLNLIGTTLFLIATGYLYGILGTLNMADIARRVPGLEGAPLMTLAALYFTAFAMKAAAFPVQAWLPAAYHTPHAATSAFFGGVLTKVGIYALLRVLVLLFPLQLAGLQGVVAWVAAGTMLFGAIGALAQSDIRRMAGFLVISGVGSMLAGLATGTAPALAGAVFYALHSMVALTAVYLLAAAVAAHAGTSSMQGLGSIAKSSPALGIVAFVLLLALCGLPGGSGLWPKVMLVKAALEMQQGWLVAALLASSLLTTIVLGRFFLLVFWRPAEPVTAASKGGRASLVLVALTFVTLVMGLLPETFVAASMRAADGLLDQPGYIDAVFGGVR